MARPPETLSTTRGRNKLRSKGDMIVTRALKLANELYQNAKRTENIADKVRAFEAYMEILPYSRPKMMSIAPGEIQEDGSISTSRLGELRVIAEQAQLEYNQGLIPPPVEMD